MREVRSRTPTREFEAESNQYRRGAPTRVCHREAIEDHGRHLAVHHVLHETASAIITILTEMSDAVVMIEDMPETGPSRHPDHEAFLCLENALLREEIEEVAAVVAMLTKKQSLWRKAW